jgi:DNA-binding FadR family transcriptional regulator
MIENVSPDPTYRSVARTIEAQIMSGALAVGQRLLSETGIAAHFGVNRSTVREAIRMLEQNGLVRRTNGGKHLFVSAPEQAQLASRAAAAIVLHEMRFEELWNAMHCLEPAIAATAAQQAPPDIVAALDANLSETRGCLSDWPRLVVLDIEFHDLVARASGNRALQLCREPISQLFYPAFAKVITSLNAGQRLLTAHSRIVEAIRSHDVAEARTWMEKHIVDFRRGYELAALDMMAPVVWPEKETLRNAQVRTLTADHNGRRV